jgi:hypothetical protein
MKIRIPAISVTFIVLLLLVALSMLFSIRFIFFASYAKQHHVLPRDSQSSGFSQSDVILSGMMLSSSANDRRPPVANHFTLPQIAHERPDPDAAFNVLPTASNFEDHAEGISFDPDSQVSKKSISCSSPSTSSLHNLSPSSPHAPALLPWPSHVLVGHEDAGSSCENADGCCGPFTAGKDTVIHTLSDSSTGVEDVNAMVEQAIVAISATSRRDAVVLPHVNVCIDRPSEGPNAGISEAYTLRVSRDGILIVCENKVGLAWALATLRQLLARWFQNKVCVAVIVDRPQLAHRGVLLDVARNFVPLSQISDLLLTMAAVKLNVLHLHLTDDQVRSLSFFAPVSLQLTLRLTPIRLSHSPVHHAQNSRLPTL